MSEKPYGISFMAVPPGERVTVKVKRLSGAAIIPRKATPRSAAYDLAVPALTRVTRGRQVVGLKLAIELPAGYEAKVEPRSGYSSKGFAGTRGDSEYRFDADVLPGKIDADYRGEIGVAIHSREPRHFFIQPGQRIAQLTIYRCEDAVFEEADELSDTDRGDGGFGHSGN